MKYTELEDKIIIENLDSFSISEVLECGQCFRFSKISENFYKVMAMDKQIYVNQENKNLEIYPCTTKEFEDFWINYFDLNRDYGNIKKIISKNDEIMKEAINFADGIRLLNQDPFECIISFIISQNNRIPMIKKVIENLSTSFGEEKTNKYGSYYAFPTLEVLNNISVEDIMTCKTGFRAKYIKDACSKLYDKTIDIDILKTYSTVEAKKILMQINGVGEKVSDCVLLFSLEKYSSFPTDVWIKRIIEHLYFDGDSLKIEKIHSFAKEKWGEYAGFAQQYLFHYAKEKKIGKK
ncbi:MAG: 8-oxoguanine DNA glycosylase [Defluviitaleaceae bacterium]|nr:8-oxoguanine DNA glycosylase [Defluviitaleaceae bacterium]